MCLRIASEKNVTATSIVWPFRINDRRGFFGTGRDELELVHLFRAPARGHGIASSGSAGKHLTSRLQSFRDYWRGRTIANTDCRR